MWGWGGWGAGTSSPHIGARQCDRAWGMQRQHGRANKPESTVDPDQVILGKLRAVHDPRNEDLRCPVAHVAAVPLFVVTDPTRPREYMRAMGRAYLRTRLLLFTAHVSP